MRTRSQLVETGACLLLSAQDGAPKPGAQCEGRWHEWQLFRWLVCSVCLLTRCPVPTCHGLTSPFPAPSWARDGCRHGNPAHSVRDNEANVFFISRSWSASRVGEGAFPFQPLLWRKRLEGGCGLTSGATYTSGKGVRPGATKLSAP